MEHWRPIRPNVLHLHQREPVPQQWYRLPDSHAYCHANGDANTDFNAYSYGHVYSHTHGDAHTDGDADSGNADGNAYLRARRHTWAVEHRCTRTECSISRWWNDRWNLRLRLWWPNLHRRIP